MLLSCWASGIWQHLPVTARDLMICHGTSDLDWHGDPLALKGPKLYTIKSALSRDTINDKWINQSRGFVLCENSIYMVYSTYIPLFTISTPTLFIKLIQYYAIRNTNKNTLKILFARMQITISYKLKKKYSI